MSAPSIQGAGSSSHTHAQATTPHTLESLRPILIKLTLSCSVPIPAHAQRDAANAQSTETSDAETSTRQAANDASASSSSNIPTPAIRPKGPPLSLDELHLLFEHLADEKFTGDTKHHAQIGACLTSLRMSGWDMSSEALTKASRIFLEKARHVEGPVGVSMLPHAPDFPIELLQQNNDEGYTGALDLVGTGGDGHDTFNVSTTAAIVAAGVPGVRVCKHGARASSSSSGSADLLAALGVPLANLTPSTLPRILPHAPFTFLFAQLYHPSLAPLAPIRRSLGFPTIFNVLGPLMNPARPGRNVLGVHSWGLGQTFAESLRKSGCERAWVVCGREGLDEISIAGPTDVWELRDGSIRYRVVSPADFQLSTHPLEHVKSGTAAENAAVARFLFEPSSHKHDIPRGALLQPLTFSATASTGEDGSFASRQEEFTIAAGTHVDAILDYVLLQSAALLYVAGKSDTLPGAVEQARASLQSGGACHALAQLARHANIAVKDLEQESREEAELKQSSNKDDYYYAARRDGQSSASNATS